MDDESNILEEYVPIDVLKFKVFLPPVTMLKELKRGLNVV